MWRSVFLACALTACVSSETVMGPNQRPLHLIECSGGLSSLGACYQEAARICPMGYELIDQQTRTDVTGAWTYPGGVNFTQRRLRGIMVVCSY